MSRYRVSSKGAILSPLGTLMLPGTEIPDGALTSQQMREHLLSGYAVETHQPKAIDRPVTETGPPLPRINDDAPKSDRPIEIRDVPPPAKPIQHVGKWNLNPADLDSKNIVELNMLIAERDPAIGRVPTREEAVAILTADYKPEGPAQ